MLVGMQDFDVNDWEKNTVYKNYAKNAKQVQWFWQVCAYVCMYSVHMCACVYVCTGCTYVCNNVCMFTVCMFVHM